MSAVIDISSPDQFQNVLRSSRILVTDFYADWCEPCKMIAPVFDELSTLLTVQNQVTFIKVNIETHVSIASEYNITSVPTIIVFKKSQQIERISGLDHEKVQAVVGRIIAEWKSTTGSELVGEASTNELSWRTIEIPKGYTDVTDQADLKGLDLLNADSEYGSVQVLFDDVKPTRLQDVDSSIKTKDWIESDTDEQLMLYIPFRSTLKVHSMQITSLPPNSTLDKEEVPMRPKTIHIYSNRANILGFDEAEQISPTQTITLKDSDWDATGTANICLRFVKFQSVLSLVLFIVDGIGEGGRTRLDRIRVIGEIREKRQQGRLEKIED